MCPQESSAESLHSGQTTTRRAWPWPQSAWKPQTHRSHFFPLSVFSTRHSLWHVLETQDSFPMPNAVNARFLGGWWGKPRRPNFGTKKIQQTALNPHQLLIPNMHEAMLFSLQERTNVNQKEKRKSNTNNSFSTHTAPHYRDTPTSTMLPVTSRL